MAVSGVPRSSVGTGCNGSGIASCSLTVRNARRAAKPTRIACDGENRVDSVPRHWSPSAPTSASNASSSPISCSVTMSASWSWMVLAMPAIFSSNSAGSYTPNPLPGANRFSTFHVPTTIAMPSAFPRPSATRHANVTMDRHIALDTDVGVICSPRSRGNRSRQLRGDRLNTAIVRHRRLCWVNTLRISTQLVEDA